MSKFDEREGNSCHIHMSLGSSAGPVMAAGDGHGFTPLMEHFLAGLLTCARELTYFFAPNINSYKRFVAGSFAPTALAWGRDNRSCALRVVGLGPAMRVECRIPGADVNPYLAVAALLAAGIHGIESQLPLPEEFLGNAYEPREPDCPSLPTSLREATELLRDGKVALEAFGQPVVDHYLNAARVELAAYDRAVTDWERIRGFERL
jgi:glutamine synthetase